MSSTSVAENLATLRPGSDVYEPSGDRLGVVLQLSGDRFLLATERQLVWVPYDWITAAHTRSIAVNFSAAEVGRFRRTRSSRWARGAAA